VASVVIVVLIVALAIFVWWWIRRRRQRIRERRFPVQFLESALPVQRVVRSPSITKFAAATDVETQAEAARTTMVQEVVLDEAQPEKGAEARTHNLRLINFSGVPSEENTAPASNAQDVGHTEEAVTVRLRRVEAQLAALLNPAVESPEELPPSYWG
jgi:cytoskeletal protein RodZ